MNHRSKYDQLWASHDWRMTKRWLSELSTSPWWIFIIAGAAYFVVGKA